ncbi:hypothetical protein [Pseudomonas sp. Leaf127]|uniref:hypothetical protein n=1 Tax=Pseudomonas sp. Leaf127 TaxID=1736267 RepID=UPI0009E9CA38|nr:hypothetical protein [Pseudomonas sp. Leaf127]
MKLLNTYEDRDDAEDAAEKLVGDKRLASERDATVTIYNLFGIPSWGNFLRLDMYGLVELKALLQQRANWGSDSIVRHDELISVLQVISKNYNLSIPPHWL